VDINRQRRAYEDGVQGKEDGHGEKEVFHGAAPVSISSERTLPGINRSVLAWPHLWV
jgi:hypothetical protein